MRRGVMACHFIIMARFGDASHRQLRHVGRRLLDLAARQSTANGLNFGQFLRHHILIHRQLVPNEIPRQSLTERRWGQSQSSPNRPPRRVACRVCTWRQTGCCRYHPAGNLVKYHPRYQSQNPAIFQLKIRHGRIIARLKTMSGRILRPHRYASVLFSERSENRHSQIILDIACQRVPLHRCIR